MANPYFRNSRLNSNTREYDIYNDATNEIVERDGRLFLYMPKTLIKSNHMLGEDTLIEFNSAVEVTLFIENYDSYEGSGDLFSRMGLQIDDRLVLSVQQDKFNETGISPQIGDIIQYPITKQLFKVNYVNLDESFNQFLGENMSYRFDCTLYKYSHEQLNTGVDDIDSIEDESDSNDTEEFDEFTTFSDVILDVDTDFFGNNNL